MSEDTQEIVIRNPGEALCLKYRDDFERALNYEMISGHLAFEPFMSAVKQDVLNSPKLADACKSAPETMINALLMAAQCKLLPGGAYDLFYLIPRWNGKQRRTEVQPMIGYKGMCQIAQRHSRVHKVEAFLVYRGEKFAFNPGLGKLDHEYSLDVDRSDENIIAAYARVVITDPQGNHPVNDDPVIWVMSRSELERSRSRSDAWKNAEAKGWNNSPWHTDYAMMCRKTVLRAVLTKGSVPRDMGVGGILNQEDATDLALEKKAPSIPKISTNDKMRQALGIDSSPDQIVSGEEAVEAIEASETVEDLVAVQARIQSLSGLDASMAAKAFEQRMFILDPGEATDS